MADISRLVDVPTAAFDLQGINGLKRAAANGDQGSLRQVAQQVESVFVQMMLKSMRGAVQQDGLLSNEQTRMFTSMYDQQIAQNLSSKGLGLADMMVKQLAGSKTSPSELAGTVPMALDKEVLNTLPTQALEQMVRRAIPSAPAPRSLPTDGDNFVNRLAVPAQIAGEESGIHHHLIMAQAALESGWGQREIMTKEGYPSHNLFGIKASPDWKGKTTEITTTEYENGVMKRVKAQFRVYDSYIESISDYVKLLTNNPRYSRVADAKTPEQAAYALQQAGYATDPQYAKKLVTLIQQIRSSAEQAVTSQVRDLRDLF